MADDADPIPSTVPAEADRRQRLLWLRDLLETTLPSCEPQNRAALAKQYRDTLTELDAIAVPEVSRRDELAAARESRITAAASQGAKRPVKRRSGSR